MTEGSMIQKFLDFAANTSFNYVTQLTLNIEPTAMTPPMVPHSLCLGEKRPRKDMAELKLFLAFLFDFDGQTTRRLLLSTLTHRQTMTAADDPILRIQSLLKIHELNLW